MRVSVFTRAPAVCTLVATLAGCATSLPPSGTVTATTHTSPAILATHRQSWMEPNAARWDLLYVSNGDGVVNVYRYWQRNLVGILTDFTQPLGECVDAVGDVYITDYRAEQLVEYAHGSTKPINVINVSPNQPYGCAVDLHSGDLAVANYRSSSSYERGNLAIYRHGKGKPIYYTAFYGFKSCAYDNKGDLLATDGNYSSSGYGSNFAYLGRKSVKLTIVGITGGSSYGSGFDGVRGIAWDGTHWVLNAEGGELYRVALKGSNGHVIGRTYLTGGGYLGPVWIYNNHHSGPQGTQVVGAWSNYRSVNAVGFWKYPAGGADIGEITKNLANPFGVAVSLKTASGAAK